MKGLNNASVVELVDTTDLKSVARKGVRVRVPPEVPLRKVKDYDNLFNNW